MKNRNFVNLNINPCKMCMPMGAVTAFKGIENSMVILHGSQGCSTYIRRHMAGHYNEPVDIASSSLNEEGTVYGGESNLKKGLSNIIKLYNPGVIGVATTCLAETIGEDIKRITAEFINENGLDTIKIIPVSTPGYGGTQFEGYFAALTGIVREIAANSRPNEKINIIAGSLSPGDVRNIKNLIEAFEIDYVFLPDISDTLDAPYLKEFRRIPGGGTKLGDIEKMAGAPATIEMGLTVPGSLSPGQYLKEKFNIPLYKCALPIGIENTDLFLSTLSKIANKPVPLKIKEERGRFIDGMIDSHKYNAEGRAAIYGEPELVYAVSKLCTENGIKPVLICTGAQNGKVKELLQNTGGEEEKPIILDDTDFETIEKYVKELKANILIGNSDGKIITEREGTPLIRIGFPIHDRVGGQRLVYTGYNGSMKLLDDIANTLIGRKYEGYRQNMYNRYYKPASVESAANVEKLQSAGINAGEKTKTHPCFSTEACGNARMHIPVAPACNISCNYCNRKFDCVNESRPGVTSEILTPLQAAEKFAAVREKLGNLKVVGIAGPGDALANFQNTKQSIRLIKEIDPDITFCLSTNGLMLSHYADEIIRLGVSHVTVTVNAVDARIGAKIYREINYGGKKLTGEVGSEILIINQLEGLKYLALRGIVCKVNIVMIKGINDSHIQDVVRKVKGYGAYMTNIMPLIPAPGSAFEKMQLVSNKELNDLRRKCECDLKQMYHCRQCRADAIGVLEHDCSPEFRAKAQSGVDSRGFGTKDASYTFAVASKSGMLVDQHFGHVNEFHLYRYTPYGINFVEKRPVVKYCSGAEECENEESKIDKTIKTITGCDAVIVLRIGYRPSKVLEDKGIRVIQTCGRIEDCIEEAVKQLKTSKKPLGTVI